MNKQHIDDISILGFSFTTQQLEDLRAAIDISLSMFENSLVDPNMVLRDRLQSIRERIQYMIERKQAYKQ